jgi:hypothetical protein
MLSIYTVVMYNLLENIKNDGILIGMSVGNVLSAINYVN